MFYIFKLAFKLTNTIAKAMNYLFNTYIINAACIKVRSTVTENISLFLHQIRCEETVQKLIFRDNDCLFVGISKHNICAEL